MCGRFTQRRSWSELHKLMDLVGPPLNLQPRYNVAPGQHIAVVCATGRGSEARSPGSETGISFRDPGQAASLASRCCAGV